MKGLPNYLTALRLVLAVAFFIILELTLQAVPGDYFARSVLPMSVALVIFTIAGVTDVLDGRLARAWNQQSDFGRIADPLADKVIICGALIYLVPLTQTSGPSEMWIVRPWMVVTILAREFLVNGIRSFAESRGIAFGAKGWGKLKMLTQSVTVGILTAHLGYFRDMLWVQWLALISTYFMVIVTIVSGGAYLVSARSLLRSGFAGEEAGSSVEQGEVSTQKSGPA